MCITLGKDAHSVRLWLRRSTKHLKDSTVTWKHTVPTVQMLRGQFDSRAHLMPKRGTKQWYVRTYIRTTDASGKVLRYPQRMLRITRVPFVIRDDDVALSFAEAKDQFLAMAEWVLSMPPPEEGER